MTGVDCGNASSIRCGKPLATNNPSILSISPTCVESSSPSSLLASVIREKKAGWWQLSFVADNNNLLTPRNLRLWHRQAESGLLHPSQANQIFAYRDQELCDRKRTHHHNRFDCLNCWARFKHQLANGHMASFSRHFSAQHSNWTCRPIFKEYGDGVPETTSIFNT